MSRRPGGQGRGPPGRHDRRRRRRPGEHRGGYAMTATTDHPELERVREARQTLVELRDWIPDTEGGMRGFAFAEVVRTWNIGEGDPIWVALTELIPPRTDEP